MKYLLAALLCATAMSYSNVRKAPYLLMSGGNAAMNILWQESGTRTDTVFWSADGAPVSAAATNEYGTDHQHRFTFGNLESGKRFRYSVATSSGLFSGSFVSPPAESATSLKFFAYGDTRSFPEKHDSVAMAIERDIAADSSRQTFTLGVGDFVLDGDREGMWDSAYFDQKFSHLRSFFANVPYQSARGNHEKKALLFKKYFPYASNDSCYWSFNYGPAHCAVVDEYIPFDSSSAQYRWLEEDLKSSTAPWKFLCFHEPAFSAGGGHMNNKKARTFLVPLAEKYGVKLIFAGHNHYYARAAVPTASGDTIQHVTVGGGGAPLYTPDLTQEHVVTATKANSYSRITIIDAHHLEFEALDMYGTLIDTFEVRQ